MKGLLLRVGLWSMLVVGMIIGLVSGGAAVGAAPLLHQTVTPTPFAPSDTPAASALEALSAAVEEENLSWENVTFWSQGTLGDPALAHLAIAFGIGEQVPVFIMPTLNGGVFDLARTGEPLLLNFWASWCGPCQMELPYLLELHADPDAPFDVVMINVWDAEQAYLAFSQAELPDTIISGRGAEGLSEQYGIQAIPVSILIDAQRRVMAVHVGNLTPAVVRLLRALAGEPLPAIVAQALPTPTPLPAIVPAGEVPDGEPSIDQLIRAVAVANADEGTTTFWREGVIGPDDGFRLAVGVGDKFPAFGMTTVQGEVYRLDLAGGPVLLNFWASWCGPCIAEFPLLVERQQSPATPYRIAFVNVWDDPYTRHRFLQDYPSDILVVVDSTGALPDAYGISFIPVSILVDAAGVVQLIQLGSVNEAVLNLAAALVRA